MKLDKLTENRLIAISDSIAHVAKSKKGHIPDKISCLKTNISLIELEIDRLKKLRTDFAGQSEQLPCRCCGGKKNDDGICTNGNCSVHPL